MMSKLGINRQTGSIIRDRIRQRHWQDILIIVGLATSVALALTYATQLINPILYREYDVWFEADIKRVFDNMSDRGSDHYRTKVHPLFSLVAFPLVYLLKFVGLNNITAVRAVILAVACLWISTLYILFRLMGIRRFDSTLFSILGATSA